MRKGEQRVGDWRSRSACLTEDPNLFFPDGTTGAALNQMEFARQVCHRCPVQFDCLQVALSTSAADGVWGGTTPEERRALRRRSYQTRTDLQEMDAAGLAEMLRRRTNEARTEQAREPDAMEQVAYR